MREVYIKVYPTPYTEMLKSKKSFSLRLANFGCQLGDVFVLGEVSEYGKTPTNRSLRKKLEFIPKTKELEYLDVFDVEEYGYHITPLLNEKSA